MVEEEVEQVLGLLVLEADDALREALVDVQRLLARDGVDADDRVLGLDGLTPDGATALARVLGLRDCRMDGPEALETLLEPVREPLVRFDLGKEECIATSVHGLVEDPEESGTRGLFLVGLMKRK